MWAIIVVTKPVSIPNPINIVSSDAPSTISGVAIGKKINKFVDERPLK